MTTGKLPPVARPRGGGGPATARPPLNLRVLKSKNLKKNSMDILEELRATLKGRTDDWSDADRSTAVEVGRELATMQARLVGGQDVDPVELAMVKASAKNLAAGALMTGAAALNEFLERVAAKALAMLNPLA